MLHRVPFPLLKKKNSFPFFEIAELFWHNVSKKGKFQDNIGVGRRRLKCCFGDVFNVLFCIVINLSNLLFVYWGFRARRLRGHFALIFLV